MSETVTIKRFNEGTPWSSPDGKINLTFYETVFDRNGSEFTANWGKKSGEPKVGEAVEGEFFQKNDEWRFRIASQGGGGGSSGGGKRDWKPESQYDPEKTARIGRAHAQGMAVQVLAGVEGFANAPKEKRRAALEDWIDWFAADVDAAAAKATVRAAFDGTEVQPTSDPGSDTPPPPTDDDIPF